MRGIRVALEGLFIGITLLGVSASSAIENPHARQATTVATSQPSFAAPSAGASVMPTAAMTANRGVTPHTYAGPRPRPRSASDLWLMALVAVTLVGHQMRRKHRFLRPHPFGF